MHKGNDFWKVRITNPRKELINYSCKNIPEGKNSTIWIICIVLCIGCATQFCLLWVCRNLRITNIGKILSGTFFFSGRSYSFLIIRMVLKMLEESYAFIPSGTFSACPFCCFSIVTYHANSCVKCCYNYMFTYSSRIKMSIYFTLAVLR